MWAAVSLLTPVNVDVFLEGVDLSEGRPTNGTVVIAVFVRVDLDVTSQGGVVEETLSALHARQRF